MFIYDEMARLSLQGSCARLCRNRSRAVTLSRHILGSNISRVPRRLQRFTTPRTRSVCCATIPTQPNRIYTSGISRPTKTRNKRWNLLIRSGASTYQRTCMTSAAVLTPTLLEGFRMRRSKSRIAKLNGRLAVSTLPILGTKRSACSHGGVCI